MLMNLDTLLAGHIPCCMAGRGILRFSHFVDSSLVFGLNRKLLKILAAGRTDLDGAGHRQPRE
jgi:hypothetical protein